jgi:hypothetical protein
MTADELIEAPISLPFNAGGANGDERHAIL